MQSKFEKIKQKYTASFAQKQADLQQAWDDKDITQLHNLLHKLAGSSGSYGFKDLSDKCQQAMTYTRNHNPENDPKLEKTLKLLFELLG